MALLHARVLIIASLALIFLVGRASPGHAEIGSLKGKTVKILVGVAPGGGFDAYARMLAPHLSRVLAATVVVENKPGAAGFNALNSLLHDYAATTQVMLLNGELAAIEQIVQETGVQYDMMTFTFLGRVSVDYRTLVTKAGGPFATLSDFERATHVIHFGSGTRIDTMGSPAIFFCYAMKLSCKLVTGYQGAPDVALAMQRGEVDALVTSESEARTLMANHVVRPIAILGPLRSALLPSTPPVFEITDTSGENWKWVRFRAAMAAIGRTMIANPNASREVVSELQAAFSTVLSDAAVIAEGVRSGRPIAYASAAEVHGEVAKIFASLNDQDRVNMKSLLLNESR